MFILTFIAALCYSVNGKAIDLTNQVKFTTNKMNLDIKYTNTKNNHKNRLRITKKRSLNNNPLPVFCPYLSVDGSPCDNTSPCAIDTKSPECKENVFEWCKLNGESDPGCISISMTSGSSGSAPTPSPKSSSSFCPFLSLPGSPCDASSICNRNSRSFECKKAVVEWCKQYGSIDTGCISVSGTATGPSATGSIGNINCPYNNRNIESPCYPESACFKIGLKTIECKNIVITYCDKHPDDRGCFFVSKPEKNNDNENTGATGGPSATGPSATGPSATGPFATGPFATGPSATGPSATGSTENSGNECPFHQNKESPCSPSSKCTTHGSSSIECQNEIKTYCQRFPTDTGCVFVAPPTGGSSGGDS